MHMPNEDDAEFADKTKAKPVPENAMKQQMMTMMQQTENLLVQQKQQLARSPRSPRRVEHAAAVNDEYISMVTENTPSVAGSGRRMGPDMFTQDELRRGHVAFECGAPRQQNNGNYNRGQQLNSDGGGTGLSQMDNGGQGLGGSGKRVPEYAEAVNEASAVSETKDEDVNAIDNGDACQKQCYDEEGVEYGNGSYVTSDYYPMDECVNEYGTSYGCGEPWDGEHNVGRVWYAPETTPVEPGSVALVDTDEMANGY
ncbi:hypothetical protein PI125_g11614 [Phytophthora idaei]|nr:hypothetical protein PI125_g11614 [Phytophthora idaei]